MTATEAKRRVDALIGALDTAAIMAADIEGGLQDEHNARRLRSAAHTAADEARALCERLRTATEHVPGA